MITESKLKNGLLTLGGTGGTGGTEFGCQPTNVRITPSHDESGDEVETLCGDTLSPDVKTTWSLAGTSIQDFDNPDGLIAYSVEHNLEDVEFVWQANEGEFKVAGTLQVRALEIGGDVNTRITSDFEWPLQGDPTFTWPTAGGAATGTETEPVAYPSTGTPVEQTEEPVA